VKAHHDAVEAQHGALEAHRDAEDAYHGAV
jgi:hypothetical protein